MNMNDAILAKAKKRNSANEKTQNNKNNIIEDQDSDDSIHTTQSMDRVSIKIDKISTNPFQPRISSLDEIKLQELAKTIEQDGLIQPITVFQNSYGYTLVAGHRRLEAHKLLKKKYIDALVIKQPTEKQLASMALIENIQREDLNIIELAMQYQSLLNHNIFKTKKELAENIGKAFPDVSKTLNVLKIPNVVLDDIKKNNTIKDLKIIDIIRKVPDENNNVVNFYQWIKSNKPSRTEVKNEYEKLFVQKNNERKKYIKAIHQNDGKITIDLESPLDENILKKMEGELEKILSKLDMSNF